MNIKQKILSVGLIASAAIGIGLTTQETVVAQQKCGDVDTSIIGGNICDGVNNDSTNAQDSAVWKLLILVLNIMTAGVGILAVAGIVYGSVLYASAGDRAEQTKKAISIITNVVVGIIAYALMYLVLNFLIPGGIFT